MRRQINKCNSKTHNKKQIFGEKKYLLCIVYNIKQMVSKRRRTIKRQRRQRGVTVKRGGRFGVETLEKIKNVLNSVRNNTNIETENLLDSSSRSDDFIPSKFTYNTVVYNYTYNKNDGLIKIMNSDNSVVLCNVMLYKGDVIRYAGFNLKQNMKDPNTILYGEIKNKDISEIFVQVYKPDNKTKLKFIKISESEESSFGTLEEFLIYLEKQYNSQQPVQIKENPDGSVSTPFTTNDDVNKLSQELTNALNCVKIRYDDNYVIEIKKVVLSSDKKLGGKSRRRKISTRQIQNIIENSIKFGGR